MGAAPNYRQRRDLYGADPGSLSARPDGFSGQFSHSALVALVLAFYMKQTKWGVFFGLVVRLTGVRAIGWSCYRWGRKPEAAATKWAIFATAGSGLSGLLRGVGSTLLLPDNIVEQTFLAFVIGGICAGALVSLSYHLPVFIAYVFSSALPLAASFLLDGRTVYVAMGCMAVVFVAAVELSPNFGDGLKDQAAARA